MIAAVATWFLTSRVGRFLAAAGALVLAVLTFGAVQRRKGRQDEHQRQAEADRDAVQRADRAAVDYHRDGGAADRLRSGRF